MNRAFKEQHLGTGTVKLKNVFIRSAAFEGMYENGLPTEALTEHHVSMAKGGIAMTTVSYGAVSPDGRTFKQQMYIHDKSLEKLRLLVEEVHNAGAKVSIQLTHCGYFTKNRDYKNPLAPSRIFNEYGAMSGILFSKEMNVPEMNEIAKNFALSALRLKEIGFDAVEIHMGHGYLLSQFLSPAKNMRKDEYGGSIQNRSRFPLLVFKQVFNKVGGEFPVLVKLNLSDGLKNGFSGEDCIFLARELEKDGCSAIILSGGFTSKTPFYLMRGKVPLGGMIRNGDSFAEKITLAIFGPFLVKKYRFEENFFLAQAKEIRRSVSMPLVYLGGVHSKRGIIEILDAGFEFIAIARALIHDPEFINKLKRGEIQESECNRCNRCVVEMDRDGVKCVLQS